MKYFFFKFSANSLEIIIEEVLKLLYISSSSISEVEKIKVTLFPLIIYFYLFLINFSDIFIVFTFSKILFRVSLIEIKLLVGLHILLNS